MVATLWGEAPESTLSLRNSNTLSMYSRLGSSPKIGLPSSSTSSPPWLQKCARLSKVVPPQRPPLKRYPSTSESCWLACCAAAVSSSHVLGASGTRSVLRYSSLRSVAHQAAYIFPSSPVTTSRTKGNRSLFSSSVKYSSIGLRAPWSMNCGTTKESTLAQSGARPTRDASSRRARSLGGASSGVIFNSSFQSGWSSANCVNRRSKPSFQLGVEDWWL